MAAPLKVCIVSPARDHGAHGFSFSLANMVAYTAAKRPDIALGWRWGDSPPAKALQ